MPSRLPRGLARPAWLAFGGVALVVACSSSSDSHSAVVTTGGSSGSDAGVGGAHYGSGGTAGSDSASAGHAAESSEAGSGGAAGSQEGTVVEVAPAACSDMPAWNGAMPLAVVSTAGDERLLSITADELDIVFLRAGAVYLAHRDVASVAFGAASAVTLPTGYVATAGAALGSGGLSLVLVSSDGQSFGALSRAARTDDFGANADTSAFLALNARALQTLEHFAAPVLAPDGKSFVFTGFTLGASGVSVVYESPWSGGQWAMPSHIGQYLLDGTGTKRALPSGLSSDSRTLFYFDESSDKELARFRDRPDAPLYPSAVALGGLAGAVPNAKCDRVYYSSAGDVLTESD